MAMFRRSALVELGGYGLDFIYGWEDYDLWLRLGMGGYTVRQVPEILCNYRVHKQSMLHQTNLRTLSIASAMRRRYVELAPLCDPHEKQFGFFVQDYETVQHAAAANIATMPTSPANVEPSLGQLLQIARAKLSRRTARLVLRWYGWLKKCSS